jgi:gliding motility associated protien GldN
MKKIILLLVTTTLCLVGVNAQVLTPEDNSVYKKEKHHNKIVQQYAPLRQADVMWSRKVWREIDLRQKINHPFYYPENDGIASHTSDRHSLIDVIWSAILEGSIDVYGNAVTDDEFRDQVIDPNMILSLVPGGEIVEQVIDRELEALHPDWDEEDFLKDTTYQRPFNRNLVKKWLVKEEWFFDRQRSVMDVRIIGLAPMIENRDPIDNSLLGGYTPLFWVYFPQAREILINAEVFNLVKNDAERRTYDDIFWKRMFGSTITKEANVMDREINQYMVGLDALLEAERIKTEIFNIDHDLWEY